MNRTQPSTIFDRAVDRFTKSLSQKQQREFTACSLEAVSDSIVAIQNEHGSRKAMRNMARIQVFLEGMDEYRKVVEAFLNCTPFMGYVWGPIRFILLATQAHVSSLDIILNAYKQIQERLPSFMQYKVLFEKNIEMRRALELYFCDILEFHYHALHVLKRPGWKRFFASFWKNFETRFQSILDSLNRHKDLIESETSTLTLFEAQRTRELAEGHLQDLEQTEKRKQLSVVLEKLEAPKYQTDHQTALEDRYDSRSGNWVFKDDTFLDWIEARSSLDPVLYINGIPGAGKTTLVSIIIEHLLKHSSLPTLYFYCKHDVATKNYLKAVLRAMLTQLASKDELVASYIYEKCCATDQGGMATLVEEVAEVAFASQAAVYIVLDGLDECEPDEARKILSWFVAQQSDNSRLNKTHMRLLCVGQRTDVLQEVLSTAPQISLENPDHQSDIYHFIKQKANCIQSEFELAPEVGNDIVTRVSKAAKSMFLFAKLVMENLLDQTNRRDLLNELEPTVFPVDLQHAYARVIATIYKRGPLGQAAERIIEWVACSPRPLRWGEVQAIFFIDPQTNTSDFEDRRLRKSPKRLCGSLVDVCKVDGVPEAEAVLTLVHDTARSYLQQKGLLNVPNQHARMAIYCINYLLSLPFSPNINDIEMNRFCQEGYYAFLEYAISSWLHHSTAAFEHNLSLEIPADLMSELDRQVRRFLKDAHIWDDLHLKAPFEDRHSLLDALAQMPQDAVARNNWAQLEGHISRIIETIEVLAEKSLADPAPATKGSMLTIYGTTLYKCPKLGCVHFQTGFISRSQRDAHVERHQRPFLCTELHCPFRVLGFPDKDKLQSHLDQSHNIVQEIDRSSFLQLRRIKGDNILKAVRRGDVNAVQSLIFSNDQGIGGLSEELVEKALNAAIQDGRLDICKVLVGNGATIKNTHLRSAVKHDESEVLIYLLKLTDDWSRVYLEPHGWPLLHIAVAERALLVVKLLLGRSDILLNEVNNVGETALHIIAKNNDKQILELLLATGKVDVNLRKSSTQQSPLSMALTFGSQVVAEAILNVGKVDLEFTDIWGDTPLLIAAQKNYQHLVQLLLTTGKVNANAKNNRGRTPLMFASINRNSTMLSMLLNTDQLILNERDQWGYTPLCLAVMSDMFSPSELDTGSAAGRRTRKGLAEGRSTLEKGSEKTEIVEMLLASGCIAVNDGPSGETPLMLAVMDMDIPVVELLLYTGQIKVNKKDWKGRSALSMAKSSQEEESKRVIELLQAFGAIDDDDVQDGQSQDPTDSHKPVPYAGQDYQTQLMLLEAQNKKRLLKARQTYKGGENQSLQAEITSYPTLLESNGSDLSEYSVDPVQREPQQHQAQLMQEPQSNQAQVAQKGHLVRKRKGEEDLRAR